MKYELTFGKFNNSAPFAPLTTEVNFERVAQFFAEASSVSFGNFTFPLHSKNLLVGLDATSSNIKFATKNETIKQKVLDGIYSAFSSSFNLTHSWSLLNYVTDKFAYNQVGI
jgi:hypothetical protein